MSVSSHNFTSPLVVYEPFSSSTPPKLRIATLNSRYVCNKSAVISDHILYNKLNIICLTETWINDGEFSNAFASSLLPPNYSLSKYYERPYPMCGGDFVIISHKTFLLANKMIQILFFLTDCYLIIILISIFSFQLLIPVIFLT